MQEIERKYLLKDSVLAVLNNLSPKCKEYVQFYTKITPDESVRYRKVENHYYKTYKKGKGAIRKEIEKEINDKIYQKKQDKRFGDFIKKKRCLVEVEKKQYSIDIYKEQLKPLIVMEIEFEDLQTYKEFKLPSTLEKYVDKEVTTDECYKNKNLALFGLPLGKKDHNRIDYVLPKILKKQYEMIKIYTDKVIQGSDDEDLHQLRIALRKSITLISASKFMFSDNSWREHKIFLKQVISTTNHKRDLDVFIDSLTAKKADYKTSVFVDAIDLLKEKLTQKLQNEHTKILSFLQSSYFEKNFQKYEDFIVHVFKNHQSVYSSYHSQRISKFILYRYNKKIKILMKEYKKSKDEELIHSVRIIFKKLRYILENYKEFFPKDEILTTIKKIKQIQKLLGEFHDICEQKRILKEVLSECMDENIIFVIENGLLPSLKKSYKKELEKNKIAIDSFVKKHHEYCSCFSYLKK